MGFLCISLPCTGYLCQLYLIMFEGSPPTSDYWTDLSFRKTARARVKESFLHFMLMMNAQNLEIILNKQYSIHSQSPEHHIIAKYQLVFDWPRFVSKYQTAKACRHTSKIYEVQSGRDATWNVLLCPCWVA